MMQGKTRNFLTVNKILSINPQWNEIINYWKLNNIKRRENQSGSTYCFTEILGNIKFCSKIAKNAKQAKSMFEFSQPFSIVLKKKWMLPILFNN